VAKSRSTRKRTTGLSSEHYKAFDAEQSIASFLKSVFKLLKSVGLTDMNIAMSIVTNVSTVPTNVAKGLPAAVT
jgi:hypothetical protein